MDFRGNAYRTTEETNFDGLGLLRQRPELVISLL